MIDTSVPETTLEIIMSDPKHSLADVARVIEDLDMVVGAVVLGMLRTRHKQQDDASREFCDRVRHAIRLARYDLGSSRWMRYELHELDGVWERDSEYLATDTFLIGASALVRRSLEAHDPDLFHALYSAMEVSRLEHNSPLRLWLTVKAMGATMSMACMPIAVIAMALNVSALHQQQQHTATLNGLHLEQEEQKIRIYKSFADCVARSSGPACALPPETMNEVLKLLVAPIQDLSEMPQIDVIRILSPTQPEREDQEKP